MTAPEKGNKSKYDFQLQEEGEIRVRIIDEKQGLSEMDGVAAIRIHSRQYVLLIMKDYTPTLGQIEGDVCFLCGHEEVKVDGIHGCFKFLDNTFTLIIEEGMH